MKTIHLIVGITRNETGHIVSREPAVRAYRSYERASSRARCLNEKLGYAFDESGECTSEKIDGTFYEVEQVKLMGLKRS